ncbi:MAG: ABC transporter permease [Anaerolineales bacterium]
MRNVWTIAKREFNMYFVSPVAYAVAFALLLVLGLIFYANLFAVAQSGGAPQPNQIISPFVTLMLFLTPALTMRLMAEEQRTGTVELLLTAPVREWELVTGKWLAAFGFVAVIIFLTGIYPLILNQYTRPGIDQGSLLATYLGLFLVVGSMLALGVFVSTLFSNQIAAFFGTMALILALWLVALPVQNSTGLVADVLNYLDFSVHYYNNFFSGVVDLSDIAYFVSLVVLFLFLAARSVESRRWR